MSANVDKTHIERRAIDIASHYERLDYGRLSQFAYLDICEVETLSLAYSIVGCVLGLDDDKHQAGHCEHEREVAHLSVANWYQLMLSC